MMLTRTTIAVAVGLTGAAGGAQDGGAADATLTASAAGPGFRFAAPVRLYAGGEAVRVETPGYAAPCWVDVDGDGDGDLLVGQFAGGRIRVYENDGSGQLGEGRWLEAEGAIAEVPGVW